MNCVAWRKMAENVADSFRKGNHIIAVGELKQRSFEDKEGNKKTVYELKADYVGVSMRYDAATIIKAKGAHPSTGVDPWALPTETQSDEVPF